MSDLLTDQELDLLLPQQPDFNKAAVKARVLERIHPSVAPRRPLRMVLLAATVCLLSVSIVTAADYVSGGQLHALLLPATSQQTAAEPVPESPEILSTPAPESTQQTVSTPSEPPECSEAPEPELPVLEEKTAALLELTPQQAQQLRPSVQNVNTSVTVQDVKMTVLQVLSDTSVAYLQLRFDFPPGTEVSDRLDFRRISFETDDDTYAHSKHRRILEIGDDYLVWLVSVSALPDRFGETATLTLEDLGYPQPLPPEWEPYMLVQATALPGQLQRWKIDPQGNIQVLPDDVPLPELESAQPGFRCGTAPDGSTIVTYDGSCGTRYVNVLHTSPITVMLGDDPLFRTVAEGCWSQFWDLHLQDQSRYWQGDPLPFSDRLTFTSLRISPLSWDMTLQGDFYYLPKEWTAELLHEDGSRTELPMRSQTGGGFRPLNEDGSLSERLVAQVFSTPISLSDVTAVIINGQVLPLTP